MYRIRTFLPLVAVLAAAGIFGMPAQVQAAFQIRVTDLNSNGSLNQSKTQNFTEGPGEVVTASFTGVNALSNFSITVVTNISDTGPGFSAHSTVINLRYTGSSFGQNSQQLLIEVLGDSYMNPTTPISAEIRSNGSPSTSGLQAASVIMTSGVIAGNVTLDDTPGNTLGGQLGMTTGTGSIGSASSVLNPNPDTGSVFSIPNPFTFYQTYSFSNLSIPANTTAGRSGSLSAGTEVVAVPVPPGVVLVVSALPVLGIFGWLRRRKPVQSIS